MRRTSLNPLLSLAISLVIGASYMAFSSPAHADYFVWQDPKTGVELTYPDTWKRIANQKPDDMLTIMAPKMTPDDTDQAICRLRTRSDKRWMVYPVWHAADVQRFAYNQTFWDDYLAEYDNTQVRLYKDDAALGKAFASSIVARFSRAVPKEPRIARLGQMWAGVYYDTAYILDCSARAGAFQTWQPDFVSIAKSVDMRKVMHELATGHYRNFVKDRYLSTPVMNGADKMGYTNN